MNLYSNKQTWKTLLLAVALLLVGVSIFFSNEIVKKVAQREQERALNWGVAIKKKAELIKLTDETFSKLRDNERKQMALWIEATKEISKPVEGDFIPDYSFPLNIINRNTNIPVILLEKNKNISATKNLDFTSDSLTKKFKNLSRNQIQKLYNDSVIKLAREWAIKNPPFTIEVYKGLFMTYFYNDSKEIQKLEQERDTLFVTFNNELINNIGMLPVLLINKNNDSIIATNLPEHKTNNKSFKKTLKELSATNKPIELSISNQNHLLLYYDNSQELKQLQYFPYIQIVLVSLFIFIGYLIFSTFRKAEQNQVWVGMAKETAHQLGTPLSSLIAWVQLLESYNVDKSVVDEMQKDVDRLTLVTERFSKIGSINKMEKTNIVTTCHSVFNYLRVRISSKIKMEIYSENEEILISHNPPLIEWVLENIMKNSVDSMESSGTLIVNIHSINDKLHIDISDTGKGIEKNNTKRIFEPGFTTKKRGWGLGLSLAKRIVNEYHKGKIFVLNSEIGKGTTFRITLPNK